VKKCLSCCYPFFFEEGEGEGMGYIARDGG